MMEPLRVVCAVIVNNDGNLLACQRSSKSSLPGMWEFPGGKIEPDESDEVALKREILEELEVSISVLESLPIVNHIYPDFDSEIALSPFLCEIIDSDTPNAIEHSQIRWVNLADAHKLVWADADKRILEQYEHSLKR